jgi:hypothetical protein
MQPECAWYRLFDVDHRDHDYKNVTFRVRAVRAF